jgi:hypothetical protein
MVVTKGRVVILWLCLAVNGVSEKFIASFFMVEGCVAFKTEND